MQHKGMADVTSRHRYPDSVQRRALEQQFQEMEARKKLENKHGHLDGQMRETMIKIEVAKQDLYKTRTVNKELQKKISDEETEIKNLHTKLGSLKVKLGLSNMSLNKGNDEKEKLRTNLNEVQVEVARLEERHTAAAADLDRLRDPANPESNMSIKKHVANDRKEIKRLKTEVDSETSMLNVDKELVEAKDNKIKVFEKELAKVKVLLKECEKQRLDAESEEEIERNHKEEIIRELQNLTIDKKSYGQRLKELKVKLGIAVANQNVSTKYEVSLKREEKALAKQLIQMEKKLKDTSGHLDLLKNQHKMSKTAQSINEYTRRNQKRTGKEMTALAQSGPGPIKFGSSKQQPKPAASSSFKGSMSSIAEKSKPTDNSTGKQDGRKGKQTQNGSKASNQKASERSVARTNAPTRDDGKQNAGARRGSMAPNSTESTLKQGPNQLVPPRKPPLHKATPR